MRSVHEPRAAEEIFQLACATGVKAAEAFLERHMIVTGADRHSGAVDVGELVATVVNAVLEDAGQRLPNLAKALDCPYPTGVGAEAYQTAISDVYEILGACVDCKPRVLTLRHARRN